MPPKTLPIVHVGEDGVKTIIGEAEVTEEGIKGVIFDGAPDVIQLHQHQYSLAHKEYLTEKEI